jgi:DNA-binding NarL/FixJ family response regulator
LVLLVEDEVLVRTTLARMLMSGGFRVVSAASADEALEVLGAGLGIKAVVTDVNLAGSSMDGFALAQRVWREWRIGMVVMSGQVSSEQGELPPGALFLAKPVHKATLIHLVRDVVGRDPALTTYRAEVDRTSGSPIVDPEARQTLTPRQHEVLELLVQGKSNREIAEAMGLSENTVKVHLVTVFKVLGVSSRTEALLAGLKRLSSQQDPPTLLLS